MNETVWNAQSSMTMDSSGLISILIILAVAFVPIGVVGFAITNLERYRRIWAILTAMGTSVVYFVYGLCVVVPLVCLYFLISWLIDFTEGFNIDPIWILYIIGGYAGISALGWIVKKGIDRAKVLHGEMKEETK
jgi:hypothetical protein